jgi:hypothetical protein
MYFTSNASGSFQIWRQRFPNGAPEQVTTGPTQAEGLAVAPDGNALVSSVGLAQRSIWISENGVERQVSSEGNARFPAWGDGFPTSAFSPDGGKLYYLVGDGPRRGFGSGELWVADLSSGSSERVLPGVIKLESGQIRKFTSESAVNSPVISPDRHSIRGRVETNAGPGHCQTTGRVSGSDVVRVCLRSELRPTEPAPNHDSAMIYRLALKHSGSNDLSA